MPMIATDKLDFDKLNVIYAITFHIVLQNDNPLVTMPFDPHHLVMTQITSN